MKMRVMYAVLAVFFLGNVCSLSAQNKEVRGKKQRPAPEQVMKMQVNQMVSRLMLDDATAAKFVPVYEKYLTELRDCRLMNRQSKTGTAAVDSTAGRAPKQALTDAEVEKMLKNRFAQSRKMLDVREKYYGEFSKILSQKQILKIYQQEKSNMHQFRKEFDRRKGLKQRQGRPLAHKACQQCPLHHAK